ncbi:MAG: C40 family peptidase [Clostridia bacterium]|nr:C40 family peptidase [Clostridia bacterium]
MNFKKLVCSVLLLMSVGVSAYAASGSVNADVLNVRTGPGTNYGISTTVVYGTVVNITENINSEWSKIEYNGLTGYVASRYLNVRNDNPVDRSSVERPDASYEQKGYTTATSLNFRSGPSQDSSVICQIPQYVQFSVYENTNGWVKVLYNGQYGYISDKYLTIGEVPQYVSSVSNQIVEFAKQFLGKPYVYGANGPNSFDCSGYTKYIFSQFGISLPRTSYTQVNAGYYVPRENLQAGDLVFFKDGGVVSHVGIYVADGIMIHASSGAGNVTYTPITSGYHNTHYYTARRVL